MNDKVPHHELQKNPRKLGFMEPPLNTEKAGGTRFSEGKPGMFWAMPILGLRLVARVVEYGARKYAPLDWQSGQSFSTLMDCAHRHWDMALARGPWARDDESGLYHLAHCAWNILAILHFMHDYRFDLDDVTQWQSVNTGEDPMTPTQMRGHLTRLGYLDPPQAL